jgi:hypothetical protein
MSIEKKSLISTLKTTKKANVATGTATNDGVTSRKALAKTPARMMGKAVLKGSNKMLNKASIR